jgi:putative membrane protein
MIATLRFAFLKFSHRETWVFAFIAVWVLSMIALPILRWTLGDSVLNLAVIITVIAQVCAAAAALLTAWGVARTARAMVIVAVATWLAETIGSHTGFPFGYYHYTPLLQPQIAGVPLFIPLAWFMMLPSAWAVAQVTVGTRRRWLFTVVSAAALTAWDFFLDPQKVAWGFWVWTDSTGVPLSATSGYYGVPWVNFLGWLLVAALVTWIVRPTELPARPLLLIYAVTWLFQFLGQLFFWNLIGPALVGFAAMGLMLALAWRQGRAA